jgi:hypothetical protein
MREALGSISAPKKKKRKDKKKKLLLKNLKIELHLTSYTTCGYIPQKIQDEHLINKAALFTTAKLQNQLSA